VGQAYTVTAIVSVVAPGTGTPTGTITVSDGTNLGTITLPATTVSMPGASVGVKTLTATYNGDASYNPSISPAAQHIVNPEFSTATITLLLNGSMQVDFLGNPTATYRVQSTESLLGTIVWTTRATRTADSLGRFQFTDAVPLPPVRFYRGITP
jgi:hypothetical protein